MLRLLNLLRRAFWQGFRHGIFMNAKGAAYSSILTVFPALIVLAWFLAETGTTQTFINQISYALGVVLPPGSRATALEYFYTTRHRPIKEIYSAMSVMVLAASGVMISWMMHFRNAYGMSRNPWNFWRERAVALLKEPKSFSARGALKVLGKHPSDDQPVALYSGKYGPYVKHGKINATLPDKDMIGTVTLEEAVELLAAKSGKPVKGRSAARPKPKAKAAKNKKAA